MTPKVNEVERLQVAGITFNQIVNGPGWSQILVADPALRRLRQPGRTLAACPLRTRRRS